jgi:hypothetical protein
MSHGVPFSGNAWRVDVRSRMIDISADAHGNSVADSKPIR